MNRAFMEEYYDLKYPDTFMPEAIEKYECYKNLYDEVMELEGQAEAAMREMGEEYLKLHGRLFVTKGKLDELIMRLAYLQGAEDRDKMLE